MARRSMTVYVNGYDEENRVRTFGAMAVMYVT